MFEALDGITNVYHRAVEIITDPLWRMYVYITLGWIVSLALCVIVGWFCAACRLTMGRILLLLTAGAVAFLFGSQNMRNIDNRRQAERDARRRPARETQPGGGWWFDWK